MSGAGERDAGGKDAGMVTAETAAVLPVLALLLAFGLWSISAVGAQLRCIDAAREAARAAARGESQDEVRSDALAAAPVHAAVSVFPASTQVRVVIRAPVGLHVRWFPSIVVSGSAVAALEPGQLP